MNNEEKILQILETMQNQIGTMQNQMNSMQESMDRQFSELREQMKADHLAVGEMFEKAYEKIGEVSDKVERIDKKPTLPLPRTTPMILHCCGQSGVKNRDNRNSSLKGRWKFPAPFSHDKRR